MSCFVAYRSFPAAEDLPMDHPMKVGSRPGASMKTEGKMLDQEKEDANLDFVAHRTLVKNEGIARESPWSRCSEAA
jgi:hypothetical protein